jgi:hypothetical protein
MIASSTASQGQALDFGTGSDEPTNERARQRKEMVAVGLRAADESDGASSASPVSPVPVAGEAVTRTDTSTRQVSSDLSDVYVASPTPAQPKQSFRLLAKWEGIVEEVLPDGFTAELHDVHGTDGPKTAEFDFEEISPSDRALIRPGAIFYWSIGYRRSITGQQERSSSIYFRRLPVRRQVSHTEVRKEAERLARLAGWDFSSRDVPPEPPE